MGFPTRSQTAKRLREPLVATGSPDRRFDRYVISVSSFTPASTRGSIGGRLKPASLPRVIVTHASRAISLFNHGQSHVAVQSPEAQRDRARRWLLWPRPSRCPADWRAVRPAMPHTLPGGT